MTDATPDTLARHPFLIDAGEVGEHILSYDWTAHTLGGPKAWPSALKAALAIMMGSPQPMFLAWGDELTFFFNDAYRPILGARLEGALGQPFAELWSDVWSDIEPLVAQTLAGQSVRFDEFPLTVTRNGYPEETWWTFSYAPLRDEGGTINGLICVVTEITSQVIGERKAAQERMRQRELLQQMPGFVGVLGGPNHIYEYVNDAYIKISGPRNFLGRSVREVFPELEGQGFYELLDQVYSTGEPYLAAAIPIRLADEDRDRYIDMLYAPIRDDEGGVSGIFVGGYDVTERVRAETALLSNEALSAVVLDASSEAFYAVDCEGNTTLCNAAFLKVIGFESREQVVGRKLHDVIHHHHPDGSHYPREECPIYRAAAMGEAAHVTEEVFFRLDGKSFPVEYRAEPIFMSGVLQGAICTFTDITERKAAQEALAESEARFRTFAQAMPNHVWASPPSGQLDWFNDRVYEYSGARPGDYDGAAWADMVHPDDVPGAAARWGASLASGETYETEFRLRGADGLYRWHLSRALPIRDASAQVVRWIGTNTDIHEQKTSAAALAALNANLEAEVAVRTADRDRVWRSSQDLLVVLEPDGKFRAVSPSVTKILGWAPDEIIGRNALDFVFEDDVEEARRSLAQAESHEISGLENRFRHKDGSFRWLSWVASPAEGMIYATGRHITAEKEAADELAAAQEALRQSQKMEAVGQLTGGIAHDFNNMLAVVIGSLDLLGRRIGMEDARARRYVDAAADGARRAALLTQRLLAFSRQQPLKPEPIDLNKLVAGMSDLLRHSLGGEVRLETIQAGGLWRTHADPNQLENVILNLAVNGRDAMPGGGRLTIETGNAHLDARYANSHLGVPAGQYVLVAVSDTGSGMPPDVIAKAFDPFFTTKEVGKGTGLGLSQVYGFIKQSGGHVKIYSEAGEGTTVKVYLPRLLGHEADATAADETSPIPYGDGQEVVLVVEDEPAVRQLSTDALSELGYRVLEADGAAAALRLLDAHPEIALLFTDVIMPDVNGRKLADEARRRRPDLKVLFTTGYTRNAVVHNGVLDPGVQLLGKPFTIEELATKVREVLDMPAREQGK